METRTASVASSSGLVIDAAGRAVAHPAIRVDGLTKIYERTKKREIVRTEALCGVDLEIADREFVSLIGPSGCGKTTVLQIIAGLVTPTAGTVSIGGEPVKGPGTDRGVVFQQPALMPWLSVLDNVMLALEFAGVQRADRGPRAERYLRSVGLSDFQRHFPAELSGGMQQRVGIARALAIEPAVLLMDEPFGALDAITRQKMQAELLRIWDDERRSVLFVTHAIDEALLLSDRIVVMQRGSVAASVTVPLPRPRNRSELLEDPEVRRLQVELEEMLEED
jgi:NitT/TauT family transport system ATP-binding protein